MIEVIVACIGFAGVIIAQIIQSRKQTTVLEEQIKSTRSELNSRIDSLEEKVDLKIDNLADDVNKHNQVIERTYKLETKVALLEQRVS